MGNLSSDGHHGNVREIKPGVWKISVQRGVKRVKRLDGTVFDDEGKPRVVYRTFHGTHDEAVRVANAIWESMDNDPNLGDKMTLGEYRERVYVPEHLSKRRKVHQKGENSLWTNHLEGPFGKMVPQKVTARQLQRVVNNIESPSVQRDVVRSLKTLVRYMRSDLTIVTPLPILDAIIDYDPQIKRRESTWVADEVLEAVERLRGDPFELFFLFMLGCGGRREEVVPLVVPRDLDIVIADDGNPDSANLIHFEVNKTWTTLDGLTYVDTKTHQIRTNTIGEPFSSRILELLPEEDSPVFPSPVLVLKRKNESTGKIEPVPLDEDIRYFEGCRLPSMTPDAISTYWKKLFRPGRKAQSKHGTDTPPGKLYGMREIKLKNLRNTQVSLSLKGGAVPGIAALAHGHSAEIAQSHYLGYEEAGALTAEAVTRELEKGKRSSD